MICYKEEMEDILLLLVLLSAHTIKVWSLPYRVGSNANCQNSTTEYLSEESNLCCKRCPPGERLKQECTETAESVCEPCPSGQYIEGWNYNRNCFSCRKCKQNKGLQYAQNCSPTTKSRCTCQAGMYCVMEFDPIHAYCSECQKHMECKAGYGVSVPGTVGSNVECKQCPDGTFSDTVSSTDPCRPHTNCHGRAVVRKGNAISDTVCGSEASTQSQTSTSEPHTVAGYRIASPVMSTVSTTSNSTHPNGQTFVMSSVSEGILTYPTKSLPPSTETDNKLVAAIASVTGIILVLIFIIILLVLCKPTWKKDTAIFHPKVDANGNCESGEEINQPYLGKTQLTSFTVTSPEQQCLLEKVEAGNDYSQCSSNTETLTRTDGCSSHESISPLQSTLALHNPHSALSEPMTLLSNTESITPQPSIPSQSSSQPTSPQIISPMTTSPHVNVNITFHIGNGSCGTTSVMPTDLMQTDSKLPFGEEEECSSTPQQEAGKQSLMSVQESASYST